MGTSGTTEDTAFEAPLNRLAAFAHDLDLGKVPADVIERAKLHVLDGIGCGLAVARSAFADQLMAGLQVFDGGTFPVMGRRERLAARDACVANGALIHTLDFDDTHTPSMSHYTASALPAVLMAGLMTKASGRQLLEGYIAAVETASRIGMAAPGQFHAAGFHPTAICGIFGSVLAIGRLLGLNAEQMANACGIAYSFGSGTNEWLEEGAWTKRLHPGHAAAGALTAVGLAKHNYVGVRKPLTGRFGLFKVFTRDATPDPERLTTGLGREWQTLANAIKPYPLCHANHAFAEAAILLAKEHNLKPADVRKGTALLHPRQVAVVAEPIARKRRPGSDYDAQFSVYYSIAAGLKRRAFGLAELEPAVLADAEITALSERIGYDIDPNSRFPKSYSGELHLELADGRKVMKRIDVNLGADSRPLSSADIVAKYRANTARLTAAPCRRIEEVVLHLERHSADALVNALVGAA